MTQALPDIPSLALDWHRAGRGAALATVVETWGSAPRAAGSQLVVDARGAMEGSVSGGCVEGAVVTEATEAIVDGRARLLDFGVSDDAAFAVGLACGGRIRVLVEPVGTALPEAHLAALVSARIARRPVAHVVDIAPDTPGQSGDRVLVSTTCHLAGPAEFPEAFRADRTALSEDGRRFVAIHNPPLRLILIGAVHIAQALAPMARACGHDVTVIDPRPAFATPERFAGTVLVDDWPDAALDALGLDPRSLVVTLTHDPKFDDPAILTALRSDAGYIGCLGSTRTHAKRVARLQAAGLAQADIDRIHAPVGLDIGARGPAEIALSILAEITQWLRRG